MIASPSPCDVLFQCVYIGVSQLIVAWLACADSFFQYLTPNLGGGELIYFLMHLHMYLFMYHTQDFMVD